MTVTIARVAKPTPLSPLDAGTELYLDLLKKTLMGSIYEEGQWTIFGHMRNKILRRIAKLLRKRSMVLVSTRDRDPESRARGEVWPIIGFTMIGAERLDNIRFCIESALTDDISGDFVECGVWRGGACIFAKAVLNAHGSHKRVWLADSFQGMPKLQSAEDKIDPEYSEFEYFAVSADQVRDHFRRFDLLDDNVHFIEGWFVDSLPRAPVKQISVLRLDGDHYSSTMDALNSLYDRVSQGGYIIIDDYNALAGCQTAVKEFRSKHGIAEEIVPIDRLGVFWRKK